jgi:hypothetical protein
MGGVGVLVVLYVWGAGAASLTLLWLVMDLVRVSQGRPPLAFAYAGLVVEGARPVRQALAALLVVLVPPLAGWLASAGCAADANCSLQLENELLCGAPAALWLVNWLFLLGPSSRTLGDRVAGGRLVARPYGVRATRRQRSAWPDALLLAPPVLALPFAGGTGGALGLLASLFILAIPVWVTRKAAAFAPERR